MTGFKKLDIDWTDLSRATTPNYCPVNAVKLINPNVA